MNNQIISIKVEGQLKEAKLHMYILENSQELNPDLKRPLVVICPGGGYGMTSDREAEGIALKFASIGCHAAVLRYSVEPVRYPVALLELATSIKTIREHAKEWYVDPDKILVQGSSAGGHLAASLGVLWNTDVIRNYFKVDSSVFRPNGMILSYPVITSGEYAHEGSFRNLLGDKYEELKDQLSIEKRVSEDTPITFVWHTFEDDCVPIENTLLLIASLRKHNIATEVHIYPKGGHGLGLADRLTASADGSGIQKECATWFPLLQGWVESYFITSL